MASPIAQNFFDVGNAAVAISSVAANIVSHNIRNLNAYPIYIKLYDKPAASVNPRTDTPAQTIPVAAKSENNNADSAFVFATAISARCVTGTADSDTNSPAVLPVIQFDFVAAGGTVGNTTLIASSVLGAPANVVTFAALGAYNHLELWIQARHSANGNTNLGMQFNQDQGNNYDWSSVENSGSAGAGFATLGSTILGVCNLIGNDGTANQSSFTRITIPNYRLTTFHKEVVAQANLPAGGASGNVAAFRQGHWKNTAAITRIDLSPNGGSNFATGSAFYLYGII